MANIMQSLKVSNKPSRNPFDMSENIAFTSCLGAYLPVRHMHLNAGDKFKDSLKFFSRTSPVRSAAYGRIRESFDTFFVPYRLLWSGAENFFSSNPDSFRIPVSVDYSTTANAQVVPFSTPRDIGDIINTLYSQQLLVEKSMNLGNLGSEPPGYNSPCWSFYAPCRAQDMSRLVEYLGYGKVINFKHNSATYENESTVTASDDAMVDRRANIPLNMLPLFAYHKIYYDFFRNTQWEDNQPHMYYFDSIVNGDNDISLQAPHENYVNAPHLLDLHYCNYEKDKYLGVLPNSQLGQPSVINTFNNFLDVSGSVNGRALAIAGSSDNNAIGMSSSSVSNNGIVSVQNLSDSAKSVMNFSILALRQASALQKFLEISQFNPQDYKHQIKAHYDFDIEIGRSTLVQYLDGCSSIVDINPVVNSNMVNDPDIPEQMPQIYGKGDNVGKYDIDFTAPEPGIVMTIYHSVPLVDYDGSYNMIPECSKHFYTDYPIPEFDNIGLQSIVRDDIDIRVPEDDLHLIDVYGYAPRYIDFKSRVDRVLGDFAGNGSLKSWVLPLPLRVTLGYKDIAQFKVRYPQAYSDFYLPQEYCRFKVDPGAADNIFFMGHVLTNEYSRDSLLVDANFATTKVSNLDRNGLPY